MRVRFLSSLKFVKENSKGSGAIESSLEVTEMTILIFRSSDETRHKTAITMTAAVVVRGRKRVVVLLLIMIAE